MRLQITYDKLEMWLTNNMARCGVNNIEMRKHT